MSGLYHAVVGSPYGTNESFVRLEYSCTTPADRPHTPSKITVDLQEGSMLNESCGFATLSELWMRAYITKNKSATFADLIKESDRCAKCNGANDIGQPCSKQFNSSITNITVIMLPDYGCPPMQLMNFMKNNVTVKDDDGLRILCAYAAGSHEEWESYTSIHVRVSQRPNNHSRQVSVTVSSTVVSLLVVVTIVVALIIAFCVVLRRKKHQHDNSK